MQEDAFMLDQLNQIDKKLDDLTTRMTRQESVCQSIQMTADKCEKLLSGNGEPERGVIVRLDRAEQTLDRQKKITLAAITAFIGSLVERFIH